MILGKTQTTLKSLLKLPLIGYGKKQQQEKSTSCVSTGQSNKTSQ